MKNRTQEPDSSEDLSLNPEQMHRLKELMREAYRTEFQAMETWGIEVVKTLFLLSGAGLAGVFALAASSKWQDRLHDLPFLPFAIGILLSVVSMALGRYGHHIAQLGWQKNMRDFSIQPKKKHMQLPNFRFTHGVMKLAEAAAYCSAAACIYAGYSLYQQFSS